MPGLRRANKVSSQQVGPSRTTKESSFVSFLIDYPFLCHVATPHWPYFRVINIVLIDVNLFAPVLAKFDIDLFGGWVVAIARM